MMSTYSQKVGSWIKEKSGSNLQDFCKRFGYYSVAVKIMALDENDERGTKIAISRDNELKELYIACSKSQKAISRKGDNRSWTQYFKDLITGWILEDLTIEQMRGMGIEVNHNGMDSKRVIEFDGNVSQDADLVVKVGDVSRCVEMTNEFNSILSQHGFIEKRAPALYNLWKNKGIWVYRDVPRGKYVLVDFATENVHLHLRHHNNTLKAWSKDVHRYVLLDNGKKERDDRMLGAELISIVGCSIDEKKQPPLEEVEDKDSPPQVFAIGGVFRKIEGDSVSTKSPSLSMVEQKKIEKNKASTKAEKKYIKPQPPKQKKHVDAIALDSTEDEDVSYVGVDLGDDDFV